MKNKNPISSGTERGLDSRLVERVLAKLGLLHRPPVDLSGLNALYAAFCAHVPFDNVRKRIWFASPQTLPLPGGDPADFFENWLRHGIGGTCWPINGGMCALARALEFDARRIVGSVVVEGYPQGANHGSVLVRMDGTDYLLDAWMASFTVLPLLPGKPSSTGEGIHDIRALPRDSGFEILAYPGWNRQQPLPFRPEPEYDPVHHRFFLERYDRTKSVGFFNDSLLVCRHFRESILTVGRSKKIRVGPDGSLTGSLLTESQRKAALIEEFGLSEEIVESIPPDVAGGAAPPGL